MSEEGDLPTVPVEAELVLWRVFGLSDVYEDRPRPNWTVEEHRGPGPNDRLAVTIGDPPTELVQALQQWRAQSSILFDAHVGRPSTHGEVDERYESELSPEPLQEFLEPYPLWFSLRLTRSIKVSAVEGVKALWFAGDFDALELAMNTFSQAGSTYLDSATARMVGAAYPMNLARLRFSDRRAFLIAPARAAWRLPKFKLSIADAGVRVGRSEGWAGAPTKQILEALHQLPTGQLSSSKLTAKAGEWYNYSAAVAEDDDLGRFVFAFAGLEVLVTLAQKVDRENLLSQLQSSLPFKELLWPGESDEFVWRNVVFRFALVASVHFPDTAVADTEAFKSYARLRNQLFHGLQYEEIRNPSIGCKELFRKYLSALAST